MSLTQVLFSISCVQMTGSQNMEKWSLFSLLDQRKLMVRVSS